ncbi:MAG: DUF4249 domain-containing protein [Chitinophagaceae bacterium]|nr:DUF4249 domain-containing protein [Chitinophagaceae bacterium]MCB9046452.1 DUF4249 domain-containing protein [Chitinophagales bacterium]
MSINIPGSNTFRITGIAALFCGLITFLSCEKEVKIDLNTGEPRLVVEGGIENDLPPIVLLTKSIGYFDKITLETLQNTSVHGAEVYVSNGTKTVQLHEYSVDTGNNGVKFYYYSLIDFNNPVIPPLDSFMVGEIEKYYILTIKYEGQTYTSTTKIPNPTPIDSILTKVPDRPAADTHSRTLQVYFKDPDTAGNYVRYYTSRNDEPMYPGLNSVYSDEIIDGKLFNTEFVLGEPRSTTKPFDSLGLCYPGDSITFKWAAIDKNVYDFWNTYEFALGTLGSPFATPIQVKSNISNNALGVWAGYGALYYTLKVK